MVGQKDVLQRGPLYGFDPLQSLSHPSGDVQKADLLPQEEVHRRLVGSAEHGRRRTPLRGRLKGQCQTFEGLAVRGGKGRVLGGSWCSSTGDKSKLSRSRSGSGLT